jgi:transposase-like protein
VCPVCGAHYVYEVEYGLLKKLSPEEAKKYEKKVFPLSTNGGCLVGFYPYRYKCMGCGYKYGKPSP